MKALILHSGDGQGFARVVLYPNKWTPVKANRVAFRTLKAVQEESEEWTWEEHCEPQLIKAGFTIPDWSHSGFYWDGAL